MPDPSASALAPAERRALRGDVLRLAWPVVLQNLLNMTMFLVDTWMIRFLGPESMAAMGVAGPISHMITLLVGALSVGAVATVARAWGEGDRKKLEGEAATALRVALAAGAPLSALGVALLPRAAELFPVPGSAAVTAMAREYLVYQGAALLPLCLFAASSGVLRAVGQTRVPMFSALAANGVNVFLNGVFIFGHLGAPRMGVAGAGLATAAALGIEAGLNVAFLFTRRSRLRLGRSSWRGIPRGSAARLARVTLPAALEPLVLQTGWLVYNKAITLLGVDAMAAHRAAITIESLTFMPGHGFAVAGSALVGQFLGAGRPDKAAASLRECALLAAGTMSAIGLLFVAFPEPLARFFVPLPASEAVVRAAATCLSIAAIEQPFLALAMALGGALRGAGDTRTPVGVGFLGVWLVRIPLAWALAFPAGLGLTGVWITMIADWLARTVVFLAVVRRGRWKTIKL